MGDVPGGMTMLPPLLPVTEDDHGAWVIVIATILLILVFCVTTITLISRIRILRKFSWSDTFLLAGTLVYLPQTVCLNIASRNGVGRHRDTINEESFATYSKSIHASQILSVVVLACSKAAVTLLVISIEPFATVLMACKIVLGLTSAWFVTGIVTLGVQCGGVGSSNIDSDECLNQEALYLALGIGHILLDIAVIALPIALMWRVQMTGWKRRQISALFALRFLILALTIAGMLSLKPYFHSNPRDMPWNAVMPSIWLQLIQSSSIVCTCIPSLKRVLADLQTGMMAGTISQSFELSVSGGHHSHNDRSGTRHRSRRSPYTVESEIPRVDDQKGINSAISRNDSSQTLLGRSDSLTFIREQPSMHTMQQGGDSRGSSSSHGLVPYHDGQIDTRH